LLTELAASNPGTCVLTSRAAVADLAVFEGTTLVQVQLENLAPDAGVRLLASMGVAESGGGGEMRSAVASFAGHALALTLLGSYLADVHGGDVRPWREVGPLQDEQRMGGHARRVMRAYEEWLGDGPEVSVLRLLGLFDRPAEPGAIRALRQAPPIAGLTDLLPPAGAWRQTLAKLRAAALLSDPNPAERDSLDTHPLIRDYFGERLRLQSPAAWRAGNERLYHYFTQGAEEFPQTLREMAPLYSAVSHGREAGFPERAYREIYERRIQQGKYFAFRSLGSAAVDLACLSRFFESPWEELKPGLDAYTQATIFNQVGVFLRAVGRLPEAIQATEQAVALRTAAGEWKDAVLNATNLSEMAVLVGDLQRARSAAEQSLDYADRSGDSLSVVISRSAVGAVLHQLGRIPEALELFAGAEAREISRGHGLHFLYSLRGFQYADCLLDHGRADEVEERARTTRVWAEERKNLLDMGLGSVLLARAFLSRERAPEALDHVTQAVDLLHAADVLHHHVRARLVRAAVYRSLGRLDEADGDLDMVQRYSSHLGLRLHAVDGELERARVRLAQGDEAAARAQLATAEEAILALRYGRR
ncbi:MAG TPA: tetratricopeptide repeat protein, partial [Armatimonadota bacterium]|nr:tetratricopeptide repeat protein [Armatimonadota bacterium]